MSCNAPRPPAPLTGRRLRVLQQELDSRIAVKNARVAAEEGMPTHCARGCDACCHGWVDALPEEAAAILDAVRARDGAGGAAAVMAAARAHVAAAEAEHAFTAEAWFLLRRPCVFLRDHACSVYEHRPAACRTYHVVSDPADCSLDRPGQDVLRINHLPALGNYLAHFSTPTDFLPALLLAAAKDRAR